MERALGLTRPTCLAVAATVPLPVPANGRIQDGAGQVITRSACQDTVGWPVANLAIALYLLSEPADMMVNVRDFSESSLLLVKIYVVGSWAREREVLPGFRRVMKHRFGTGLRIEIEAFEASPSAPSIVSVENF